MKLILYFSLMPPFNMLNTGITCMLACMFDTFINESFTYGLKHLVNVPEKSSIHMEQSLCFPLAVYTSASETIPHNIFALTRSKTDCYSASKLETKQRFE